MYRILVVEDDPSIAELMEMNFSVAGYLCDVAADGKQAQAVFCSPAGEAEQRRPHAQREFVHLDAAELRSEEMPQLMNENHNAEYEYRRQHRNEKRPRAAEK